MERSALRRPFYRYVQRLQTRGILEAGLCFNAEMSLTREALNRIGRSFEPLAIPMLYNREQANEDALSPELQERARQIRAHPFVVFCHARHLWVRDPAITADRFRSVSKNSDWLIRGFADFRRRSSSDSVLCLLEYGPDVTASKQLVRALGIEPHVIWLPKMKRREIMHLLQIVDVGVGEFHTDPGLLWGGTGWEILASGKPLIQCFNFTEQGFQEQFGHLPPSVLDARSPDDVARNLSLLHDSPILREQLGARNAQWFEQHNGLGLARRWLDLLRRQSARTR